MRTYEQLADKARSMLPQGSPVTFTALDWGVPRKIGMEIELPFAVHGHKRIAVRLDCDKAARLCEALALAVADPLAPHL